MCAIDAGSEDKFGGDDAHGLFLEVGRNAGDDGGMVEEALVADAYVGGETGLGFVVFASEWRDIARRGLGETGQTTGKVEDLGGGERSNESGEVRSEEVHAGLHVGSQDMFCTI